VVADPLVMNPLDSGLARPGSLGLGVATDPTGRVLPAAGAPPAFGRSGRCGAAS